MSILIKTKTKYEGIEYIHEFPGIIRRVHEYENGIDFIHIFVDSLEVMENEINKAKDSIRKDGMIWISWPKKRSEATTDISEDRIREVVLPIGLVDVKVCAVTDEFWSGLKIVWRKENR